ncbi:MAG: DNA polymerase III subunit delta' [Thermodesulfobacteriota bacterium]
MTPESPGPDRVSQVLSAILAKQAVPNALLFSGQAGLGRYEKALSFAMALNCERGPETSSGPLSYAFPPAACGKCHSCRKILAGNHPDVLSLAKDGAFIKIGQVRSLLSTLALRPGEGAYRVVIVRDAESLNREAANALLKVLEEPPERTVFILTASRPADLLPTIVSRCRELRFHPEPEDGLALRLSREHGAAPREAEVAAGLSGGSFSRAVDLLLQGAAGLLDRFSARLSRLAGLAPEQRLAAVCLTAESMCRDRDALALDLDMLAYLLRGEIAGGPRATLGLGPERALSVVAALFSCQRDLARNVAPRLAVEALLLAATGATGSGTGAAARS